jgi:hypothetical protein
VSVDVAHAEVLASSRDSDRADVVAHSVIFAIVRWRALAATLDEAVADDERQVERRSGIGWRREALEDLACKRSQRRRVGAHTKRVPEHGELGHIAAKGHA